MKTFTIKELSEEFKVSERTILRQIQTISDNENEEFPHVEYFTSDEYEEFKKRITEYPFLKEQIESSKQHLEAMEKQIEYFRFSYNKQLEIHEKLIDSFRERNFIEAKEKGLDN